MHRLDELERRMAAIEKAHAEIGDIVDLVQLLRDVRGALSLFARLGKVAKWLLKVIAPIAGLYYLIRYGSIPEAFTGMHE